MFGFTVSYLPATVWTYLIIHGKCVKEYNILTVNMWNFTNPVNNNKLVTSLENNEEEDLEREEKVYDLCERLSAALS